MLIVCSGPDTYRALQKAQELERAFAAKFDKQAYSIERLSSGKEAMDFLVAYMQTPSLFAPRRFFRTNDLIASCPKTKLQSLVNVLKRDAEGVIVVSLEEQAPSEVQKRSLAKEIKYVEYPFITLQGSAFLAWAQDAATAMKLEWNETLRMLAQGVAGDSWSFVNEIKKIAAGSTLVKSVRSFETSIYEIADSFIKGDGSHYIPMFIDRDAQDPIPLFIAQSRNAIRVRDGFIDGLHPYAVRKMLKISEDLGIKIGMEEKMNRAIHAQICQRTGLLSGKESASVL